MTTHRLGVTAHKTPPEKFVLLAPAWSDNAFPSHMLRLSGRRWDTRSKTLLFPFVSLLFFDAIDSNGSKF